MKNNRFYLSFFAALTVYTASADETSWTTRYKRFAGTQPPAEAGHAFKKFFEDTLIANAKLDANSLRDAVPKIQALVEKAGSRWGVSLIIRDPNYAGYSKPLHLNNPGLSLAELIDLLAAQGDFYWDFSDGKLTIRPPIKP